MFVNHLILSLNRSLQRFSSVSHRFYFVETLNATPINITLRVFILAIVTHSVLSLCQAELVFWVVPESQTRLLEKLRQNS